MRPGPLTFLAAVFLVSCGYHLAGQSEGVIPPDVHSLTIIAEGEDARPMIPVFHRHLLAKGREYRIVENAGADAELRIGRVRESFRPVAFDVTGIAIAYNYTLRAELALWRAGKRLWSSGLIQVQGDVFAEGGPASIEASRERVTEDLRKQWAREAWSRLSSGF
jgi:outer membrane lipopolysaccharide assembly protein LptE/RlpB